MLTGAKLRPRAAAPIAPTSRTRNWIARLTFVAAGVLALGVVTSAVFVWQLPNPTDAHKRVAASQRAHHATHTPEAWRTRIASSIIAVEDARFYHHSGIDVQGLLNAAVRAVRTSGDPGGSTITMQLAKQLYANGHGLAAKPFVFGYALRLDGRFSKHAILGMYLDVVYFGHGYWGINRASRGYFHKAPAELDWAEASMLAGLLQAPSDYDPIAHFDRARQRQRHVLDRLVATHVLTRTAAERAEHELSALDR